MLSRASHVVGRSLSVRYAYREMSTEVTPTTRLRRSYLYVPCSSDRMLEKSLSINSDVITYDLEDSVPPSSTDKKDARDRLIRFLKRKDLPDFRRIAVRVNDITTPFFQPDIAEIASHPAVHTLILPKVHSAQDLHHVSRAVHNASQHIPRSSPLNLIPSIESARASCSLGEIAGWKSEYGHEIGGRLAALLFAAEDFCADTSIIRTTSRQELLFIRSQIVITAKAFGLGAIDMVCIDYKNKDYLETECVEGRRLGFTGKQAIHPSQVDSIHATFVPTEKEIIRAIKILNKLHEAHATAKGAVGLEGEMIDAPMLKQAKNTIEIAKAADLVIFKEGMPLEPKRPDMNLEKSTL